MGRRRMHGTNAQATGEPDDESAPIPLDPIGLLAGIAPGGLLEAPEKGADRRNHPPQPHFRHTSRSDTLESILRGGRSATTMNA